MHGESRGFLKVSLVVLGVLSLPYSSIAQEKEDEGKDVINQARVLMAGEYWSRAAELLKTYQGPKADYAAYLMAFSLSKAGTWDEARKILEAFPGKWPESEWCRKADLLLADGLFERKDFKGAEALLRAEAEFILSSERKRDIAGIYLNMADTSSKPASTTDPGGRKPDYDKALRLYNFLLNMDLPEEVKGYAHYRRARVALDAGRHHEAAGYFREYFQAFDPFWRAEIQGELPGQAEKVGPGTYLAQARLGFIEASLKQARRLPEKGDYSMGGSIPADVSVTLDNLLKHLRDGSIRTTDKETAIAAVYFMPFVSGLAQSSLDTAGARKAAAEAQAFIKSFPSDVRSLELMRLIPEAFLRAGLTDDALVAYAALIKGEGLALPDAPADGEGLTPRERLRRYQAEALFRSGQVVYDMGWLSDAAKVWRQYLKDYPDGSRWTEAQAGIYRAMKIQGTRALEEERFEECRTIWKQVISERPLDGETPWLAMALAMSYSEEAKAQADKQKDERRKKSPEILNLHRKTLEELARVAQRYTSIAPYVHFRRGEIYRQYLDDLEAAVNEYQRSNLYEARQALDALTKVNLSVETPRVFRNREAAFVKLATRNVPKVTIKVYKVDLEDFFNKYHTTDNIRRLDLDLVSPDRSWDVDVPGYAKYRDIEHELPVEVDGPGAYAVTIESEEYEATALVLKSDIEFIAASSYDEVVVLVKDAVKETAVEGARVVVYGGDKKEHTLTLTTGRDGVATGKFAEAPALPDCYYFADYQGNAAVSGGAHTLQKSAGLQAKGYIYSSRPVYLPGETVNVRGIIRTVKDGAYAAGEGDEYEVSIIVPDGRRLAGKKASMSRFGTFTSDFDLPDESPLGSYVIRVEREETKEVYTGGFQVQIVQPRKVFVEVTPSAQAVVSGDPLDVKVKAAYYTGLPLADRSVVLALPDGRRVTLVTDKEGLATHPVDTTPYYRQFERSDMVNFSASIPGEDAWGNAVVQFLPAALKMVVEARQENYFVKQRVDFDIAITSPDDEPLAGHELSVEVYRPGKPLVSGKSLSLDVLGRAGALPGGNVKPKDVKLDERKLKTDRTGKALLSFIPADTGRYKVIVSAADGKKRVLSQTCEIQVAEPPSPALAFETEETTLKVGDKVKMTVRNEDPDSLGLILLTGDRLISYSVHRFAKGAKALSFTVLHEHFPNFTLIGLATGEQRLNRAEQPFKVERALHVEIKLPEGPFAPGAEVDAEVTVKDHDGRPVVAELALSLVDKGLLAIYPDLTMDVVEFFEKGLRRTVDFRDASSIAFKRFGEMREIPKAVLEEAQRLKEEKLREAKRAEFAGREMAALAKARAYADGKPAATMAPAEPGAAMEMEEGADRLSYLGKGGGAGGTFGYRAAGGRKKAVMRGGGAEEAVRREIPIGAFWLGSIVTDENGKATVKIEIPERTSSYRLQLRGVTPDTLLGQLEDELTVRRDLFIDLKIPGHLFEGDKVRPIAQVHNTSDFEGEVELKLDMISEGRTRSFPLNVNVAGRGVFEAVSDAYDVPPVEKLTAVLSAVAKGRTLDKIAKDVDVRLWGVEERAGRMGTAARDVSFTLSLPSSVRQETVSLDISLFPGVEAALVALALESGGELQQLGLKAAACRVIAVTAVADYLGEGRVASEQVERLKAAASSAASALVAAQRSDGSFPWIFEPNRRQAGGDLSTTAWAALALDAAVERGLMVDASPRDKAVNYLKRYSSSGSTETVHMEALHALAVAGEVEFPALNRLYRMMDRLDAVRKSLLGLAFLSIDKGDYARNVGQAVLQEVQSTRGRLNKSRDYGLDPAYTRALALWFLGRAGGFENEAAVLADEVRKDLDELGASGQTRWLALAALTVGSGPVNQERPAFSVEIDVNDKNVASYEGGQDKAPAKIDLAWAQVGGLPAKVTLRYKGRGTLAYRTLLKGFSPVIEPRTVFHWGLSSEDFYHSPMLYKGRRLQESDMKVARVAYNDHVEDALSFTSRRSGHSPGNHVVLERWIPAGMVLDKTSLPSNALFVREAGGKLTMVFQGRPDQSRMRLLPFCPGEYRSLPTEMASADDPTDFERLGKERAMSVLVPGEIDDAPYQWSQSERVAFGLAHFNDNEFADALNHLSAISRDNRKYYRDVVRALLWIHCVPEHYKPAEVVDLFEILEQRYSNVNIPYAKMLVIGRAYHDSGEDEAACYMWRSTLENSFRDDIPVAAELEQAGEYLRGAGYLRELFRQYPDLPLVQQTLYQLSQDVYAHKDQAGNLVRPGETEAGKVLPEDVLAMAVDILKDFLAMFPDLPYADEATFSLLNAYLELSANQACFLKAEEAIRLYPKSKYFDRFRYVKALAAFHLQRFEEAIAAAEAVGGLKSPDAKYATFILGQMYQALGRYAQALEAYRKVKEDFADAAFSIEYLERRSLSLPEATAVGLGEPVVADVSYCNLDKVEALAYRVDLMRLFLKEKNLDRIAGVNLAGITPTFTFERELPKTETGLTGKARISLPIKETGAYLVLAHSGDVFASGLALVSPLKMEVQEYQGMVRVTIRDTKEDEPAMGVRITASTGYNFVSGKTDLRGSASLNISGGRLTVIARRGKDEYAFYRSEEEVVRRRTPAARQQAVQYDENVINVNRMMQQEASRQLRGYFQRRSLDQQGVMAEQAR